MKHEDAVRELEDLTVGDSFTTTGIISATRREDGGFVLRQSGILIGEARNAESAARSINPDSRPRSTPRDRERWAKEGKEDEPAATFGCRSLTEGFDGSPFPPVDIGATAKAVAESDTPIPDHDCMMNAVPYVSDGPLGHGWECGICGEFLQAG
jgi:hypothetical protein